MAAGSGTLLSKVQALAEPQEISAFILVSNLKTLRLHFQIKVVTASFHKRC